MIEPPPIAVQIPKDQISSSFGHQFHTEISPQRGTITCTVCEVSLPSPLDLPIYDTPSTDVIATAVFDLLKLEDPTGREIIPCYSPFRTIEHDLTRSKLTLAFTLRTPSGTLTSPTDCDIQTSLESIKALFYPF